MGLDCKIKHTSDRVAKFYGDRPRELDLAVKKETSAVKHKTAGNYRSGRPDKTSCRAENDQLCILLTEMF